jgi:hemerythrin
MTALTWKDEYSIGIEEIDKQHMDFVKLINRFVVLFESGAHLRLQDRILLELHKYAEYHFVSEENLMIIYKYPEITSHEQEHKVLLKTFQNKVSGLREGSVNGTDLIKYLSNWFLQHTQEEDRRFAQHINRRQATPVGNM